MRQPFDLDGIVVAVSTSVGVAFYQGGDEITAQELIRQADVMLYQAKQGGRDSFCVASLKEEISVPPDSVA